jgi:hypothetical protein
VHRFVLVLAALAAALVAVPAALGVRVHVRVEGKTRTIFGAAEPVLNVKASALDALEAASLAGEFYYHVTTYSFGPFVDQIGRYPSTQTAGWLFKVDGAEPPVGAAAVTLRDGDRVLFYWTPFGSDYKGEPTLFLRRARRGCYAVSSEDAAGKRSAARGALLHVDGRSVRAPAGTACVGRHRGLVRATMAGAIRSNALP